LKKTVYDDGQIPIIEILYSVTVYYPKIYRKGSKGLGRRQEIRSHEGEDTGDKKEEEFDERMMEQKQLIIHSPHLMKALRSVVEYYPGQSLLGDTITINEPCSILVHYRKELREYGEQCADAEATHHISVLLKYLEDNLGYKIHEEDARYQKSTPVATFEMLWMLFKPGMDVYAEIDEQRGGFVVQSTLPVTENRTYGMPMPLKVMMWYLDYDGIKVRSVPCSQGKLLIRYRRWAEDNTKSSLHLLRESVR
jgi:hypothetical protein